MSHLAFDLIFVLQAPENTGTKGFVGVKELQVVSICLSVYQCLPYSSSPPLPPHQSQRRDRHEAAEYAYNLVVKEDADKLEGQM
jgi:hypothetical protein